MEETPRWRIRAELGRGEVLGSEHRGSARKVSIIDDLLRL